MEQFLTCGAAELVKMGELHRNINIIYVAVEESILLRCDAVTE
jgi:hypothetical protein